MKSISNLLTLAALGGLVASLPATAGTSRIDEATLPGLTGPVQVLTDTDGLPHIFGTTELDVVRVQGWVHARDRMFQMDSLRREASGTLAELVGPAALGSDVELRTLGLRRGAEASLDVLSAETIAGLEAYAEGVNAWLDANPLPAEYALYEITAIPEWTPVDSLVLAKALAFSLSFDIDAGATETLMTYEAVGDAAGFDGAALFFDDLNRSAPFDPASTVPDATGKRVVGSRGPAISTAARLAAAANRWRPSSQAVQAAVEYAERAAAIPLMQPSLDRRSHPNGSNEWVISAELAAAGRPILSNDPHLSLGTPATFYHNHLRALPDGLEVSGSSLPGLPYVVLGQNAHITWGATTNGTDVTDMYEEEVVTDPDSPTFQSTVYQGQLEPTEFIGQLFWYNILGDEVDNNIIPAPPGGTVDGVFIAPLTVIVPRRNNGAIVVLDGTFGLSIQYTGTGPTRELDTFRMWNKAQNLDEFRDALQFFDFGSQNFAYADVEGNIAYFTSAEVPVREDLQAGVINGLPPSFIRNGQGGNEWLPVANPQPGQAIPYEILPPSEQPSTVNPQAGFFINANNDPAGNTLDNDPYNELRPGGGIYYLERSYAIGTRAGRITDVINNLAGQRLITIQDMQNLQADVVMLDAQVLTPYLLAAFDNAQAGDAPQLLAALATDPRVIEAAGRLAAWNHSTPTGVIEGYDASDIDGKRSPPTADEIDASIATTIYSVWRSSVLRNVIDAPLQALGLPTPGSGQSMKALRHLLDEFDTQQGVGASGLDFFSVDGLADADDRRDYLLLLSLSDALDNLAGPDFAGAFAGSQAQDDYRWGRLHRVVLRSLPGGDFDTPPNGGTFPPSFDDLDGLATDGGFGVVDASSHSARAANTDAFMFGSGPVRRYVGRPGFLTRILAESALPGGNSGVTGSPFATNLLGRWLTNDYFPMRIRRGGINAALSSNELFVPEDDGGAR